MNRLRSYIAEHPLYVLLLALPVVLAAQLLHWPPLALFVVAALAIIPMAGIIGDATEDIAAHTDPRMGALLNATFGNAAELIITITAVSAGLLQLVIASITGSIIGNLLLVLGFSMTLGGIRHGTQTFNKSNASRNAILLVLAVTTFIIPSLFSHTIEVVNGSRSVEALSIGVAIVMIILYGLGLYDAARSPDSPLSVRLADEDAPKRSMKQAIIMLLLATVAVVWLSEALVGGAEGLIRGFGVSELFLGIILVPIIGNVAEHLVSVQMALKNKMDLSTEIAISSSLQIALFVAPLLVFISLLLGHPLQLVLNVFEMIALLASVGIAVIVSADGESTWLEGAGLLAIYTILGLAFFLLP